MRGISRLFRYAELRVHRPRLLSLFRLGWQLLAVICTAVMHRRGID